jgi:hypothetical protein
MLSNAVSEPRELWEFYSVIFGSLLIFNVIPGLAIGLLIRVFIRDDWKACGAALLGCIVVPVVCEFAFGHSWGIVSMLIAYPFACAGIEAGSRLTVSGKRALPPNE